MTAEPLLTARDVARYLHVHPNTVKRIDRALLQNCEPQHDPRRTWRG